jgi:hypothetical protein
MDTNTIRFLLLGLAAFLLTVLPLARTFRRIVAALRIGALSCLVVSAAAQDPRSPDSAVATPDCISTGSRARRACEPQPKSVVAHVETELSVTLELPPPRSASCQATIAVDYSQRNTVASVEGTIGNPDCAASDGDYSIAINIKDENGERKTLEFAESWRRDDDQPVKFSAAYPIGENVDLVNVRPKVLRCTCAAAPAE